MKTILMAALLGSLVIFFIAIYGLHGRLRKSTSVVASSPARLADVVTHLQKGKDALEIIGLGVTVDSFRQGDLWKVLAGGAPFETIRNTDPKNYPWGGIEKMQRSDGREGASVENAVLDIPRYWGIPVFNGEPPCLNEDGRDRPDSPQTGIASTEVMMNIPIQVKNELSERPDRIFEIIFEFFEKNPAVPFIVLGSSDSPALRARYAESRGILEDGWEFPARPDTSVMIILARRDRIEALRPFAFRDLEEPQAHVDILNRDGIARRVWLNYLELKKKVPIPKDSNRYSSQIGRQPTSTEWLESLEVFAKQFPSQETSMLNFKVTDALGFHKPKLSRDWKPTPWFPVPWNTEQLEQFDRLPTLGFLHRPVFVKMTDADGHPLQQDAERQAALHAGWKAALETLPEAQRATGPARVIVATGGKTAQLLDFHGLLSKVAAEGGPQFDPTKANQFIDTDRRLGNTGAATFFVQSAIGVLGSYREGGISAAFNLRDPSEASIIMISPPSEEKRKTQQHPIGGDVFKNATVPTYDPRNYEEPNLH